MGSINVYGRWRPIAGERFNIEQVKPAPISGSGNLMCVKICHKSASENRSWESPPSFDSLFQSDDNNQLVYEAVLSSNIPKILRGENCTVFAYGHSGSGKTHTILGYDFEQTGEIGLCLSAAKDIFLELQKVSELSKEPPLGIGFSMFELRQKSAFDLLNSRTKCHVRQGADGRVHIRGETEVLEGGKVRVCPIVQIPCWDYDAFCTQFVKAVRERDTGSSTIHDQSSRTHAVIELEVVSQPLVDARKALYDRQSELVPVGKRAADVKIEEYTRSVIQTAEGSYIPNPHYPPNQALIDAVEAEQARFEARVTEAEDAIDRILATGSAGSLGAKMAFVDLAGAEYSEGTRTPFVKTGQTAQERQEGRQINTDLLALKEVMRAWAQNGSRIPFRSSTLTMVLREHFVDAGVNSSSIIVTLSPAENQYTATLNSLKYASLVGATRK